ncbi:hypothetical protein BRD04_02710 [Halobacteriales archaeon QS_9_67_17]|nr:MAG: hypothetical protein BRD04_02710 [Halobacteriales archaeon QS_9_67_17]
MCTLTFAWQRFDEYLAVAANRDESHARPASGPAVRGDDPQVFTPRDDELVGVLYVLDEPSIGLHQRDNDRLLNTLEELRDLGNTLLVVEHDETFSVTDLAPGVYVLGNTGWCGERAGPDDASERQRTESFFVPGHRPERGRRHAANERRLLDTLLGVSVDTAAAWLDAAGELLGDHDYGVCVHGDGFGTKSASLVRLGDERAWAFADGPPCETAFEWLDAL